MQRDIDCVAGCGSDHEAVANGVVGADHLGNPPTVVAQQGVGSAHDACGAAIIDLERVLAGAGEEVAEFDQPGRIGAVVAVNGLVIITDAEHGGVGTGEQPNQQDVRGSQILKLVDQQQPARPLRRRTSGRVAQE